MNNKLAVQWISDVIGDDYLNWKQGDIVTIESQTNTGKTTFVLNQLHNNLKDNETMLYVCNRKELKRQIKIDLLKKNDLSIPESIEELDKLHTIGKVTVLSYQSIGESLLGHEYEIKQYVRLNYKYIICDEVHFFFSDSPFNNKTFFVFKELILSSFDQSIRVLISGTMEEIYPSIEKAANKKVIRYSTGKDYSYLDTKYFYNLDEIGRLIRNDNSNDKWLIFVTSKNKGNKLRAELNKHNIKTVFITSESKHKERSNIINNQRFNCKVLIATKCLDNGISIHDEEVKHIVVSAYDKITFLQEIGRVRVDILNPRTINLYIDGKCKRDFISMKNSLQRKKEILDLYSNDYNKFEATFNHDTDQVPRDIFYIGKATEKKWQVNLIALARLQKDYNFFIDMVNRFYTDGKNALIYEQLKWLGKEYTFRKNNLIQNVKVEEEVNKLNQYLNTIVGKKLFKEDQQELSNLLINELLTLSTNKIDYRTKILKPATIETILRDDLNLPYAVSKPKAESRGENRYKKYIIISKIN